MEVCAKSSKIVPNQAELCKYPVILPQLVGRYAIVYRLVTTSPVGVRDTTVAASLSGFNILVGLSNHKVTVRAAQVRLYIPTHHVVTGHDGGRKSTARSGESLSVYNGDFRNTPLSNCTTWKTVHLYFTRV